MVPPEDCIRCPMFLEQTNNFIDENDDEFKRAVSLYKRKLLYMTIDEIYDKFKDKTCLFNAIHGNVSVEYYDRETSLDKLVKFLSFQIEDPDAVPQFMELLYMWLNKLTGKKNTIWLQGPADCGKSWFITSLENLCITTGRVSVMNRTNNFPLSSCTDTKLIVLDELSYDPTIFTDTLKLLLGGNALKISKKYCNDVTLKHTPVIIASNGECIPDTPEFKARINKFIWKKPKDTSIFKLKIHPWAFFDYWNLYKINTL